jgi:rhodanese-related sulfurtransferase
MPVNLVSIPDFKQLLDQGRPLNIFDVRTPAEFDHLHVRGARLMPFDALDVAAIAAARRGAADAIYLICQSGGRAGKACERLTEAGLANVYSIEGGTTAWEKAGLPVERGSSRVISLERQVRIGAGALVAIGVALGWTVHPDFLVLPAFVGCGLVFAGVTDFCGMGMLLAKMPWNRRH